jgi:hypothetical protein
MGNQVEMYRAARERLRAARLRGDDTDGFEAELRAIWSMMSGADRRAVLGVGERSADLKRAA